MKMPNFTEWTLVHFIVDKSGVLVCTHTTVAEAAALRVEQRINKGNLVSVVVYKKRGVPDVGQFT